MAGAKKSRTRVSSDKCLLLSLQNALLGDGVSFPGSVLLSCIVQYSQNRAISGHFGGSVSTLGGAYCSCSTKILNVKLIVVGRSYCCSVVSVQR